MIKAANAEITNISQIRLVFYLQIGAFGIPRALSISESIIKKFGNTVPYKNSYKLQVFNKHFLGD